MSFINGKGRCSDGCPWPHAGRMGSPRAHRVTAIVSQAGSAFQNALGVTHWQPIWDFGVEPTAESKAAVRRSYTLDAIRWRYLHGLPDASLVSPDTWYHDWAPLARPGMPTSNGG